MAIDEELIEKTILKLGKRLEGMKEEQREIQKHINGLYLIRGSNDNPPKDPITEEPMSETRIKEIFNSIAKKASKYMEDDN